MPLEEGARSLLGQTLIREVDGYELSGKIVEVELYHENDPASHTYRGESRRNQVMYAEAGRAYIYLSYGIHHCLNVTLARKGEGAAALIRALEPLSGIEHMQQNRIAHRPKESAADISRIDLCSGPGKLTQALDIDRELNGHSLHVSPLYLCTGMPLKENEITATRRIGISRAKDALLRYYVKDSPYISRP